MPNCCIPVCLTSCLPLPRTVPKGEKEKFRDRWRTWKDARQAQHYKDDELTTMPAEILLVCQLPITVHNSLYRPVENSRAVNRRQPRNGNVSSPPLSSKTAATLENTRK